MAEVAAGRLDALWRDGPFRGQAAAVAAVSAEHPDDAELRAFAMLAALRENDRARLAALPGLLEPPAAAVPEVHALVHAANAWLGAVTLDATVTWEAQRRLGEALEQAAAEHAGGAAEPRGGGPAVTAPRRIGAARAWGSLAVAEGAVVGGELETARRHLKAVAAAPETPPACRLAAAGRLAELDGVAEPRAAVRRLDGVTEQAERLEQAGELLHALTIGGLLSLAAGDRDGGRSRLRRATLVSAPDGSLRHHTLARMLLAVTEDRPGSDGALQELAEAIRLAAADGDSFSYLAVIGLAARVYHARGADADAVLTLSNGIHQLRSAGLAALALGVEAQRDALRAELGEERYAKAMEDAVALLERDLQRTA